MGDILYHSPYRRRIGYATDWDIPYARGIALAGFVSCLSGPTNRLTRIYSSIKTHKRNTRKTRPREYSTHPIVSVPHDTHPRAHIVSHTSACEHDEDPRDNMHTHPIKTVRWRAEGRGIAQPTPSFGTRSPCRPAGAHPLLSV